VPPASRSRTHTHTHTHTERIALSEEKALAFAMILDKRLGQNSKVCRCCLSLLSLAAVSLSVAPRPRACLSASVSSVSSVSSASVSSVCVGACACMSLPDWVSV
jgi:hypothetical protein